MSYVTRCVCFGVSFEELQEIAEDRGCKTIEDLRDYVDFGLACSMCNPYVLKMLETGETEFHWKDLIPRKPEDP